jgi:molybdate transport system substrate-binding protein
MQNTAFTPEEAKMRRRRLLAVLGTGWAALATREPMAQQRGPALVAVAASVQGAMEDIAPAWMRSTGHRVRITYGSSGNFVRQIQQGLPVELFLSADEAFALKLADAGLTRDRGVIYASGRLALLVARESAIGLDPQLQGLKSAWPTVRKFAIANPELAPYGKAAREVLQTVGLWEPVVPKLVLGENIAQATQFVATGAAQAGITALSLVTGNRAPGLDRYIGLPDNLHAPLRQRMVLLAQAGSAATAFYEYLQSSPAKALLRRHGFAVE